MTDPAAPASGSSATSAGSSALASGSSAPSEAAMTPAEAAAMARAAELAALGRPTSLPNPVVGCVILNPAGETVGEGWHEAPGGPHAEVVALAQAGPLAVGATAVVTLEPCNHTGRTGPCSQALLAAGIARVVIGAADPFAEAAGGAQVLRDAGLQVLFADGEPARLAHEVNRPWLIAVQRGRPYVTYKVAGTLDGRAAAADGTSQWITGQAARADVHLLRSHCDAILAGIGTVLADDPSLTARPGGALATRQPLRVVLDSQGRTPATAKVLDDTAPTWVVTAAELPTHSDGTGLDLEAVLAALGERSIRHLLIEGGPQVGAAFLRAGLVDEVVAYLAPAFLGSGAPTVADLGITTMDQALRMELVAADVIGSDVRIRARITR